MPTKKFIKIFTATVIGLGVCSLAFIFFRLNLLRLNILFLVLSIFAVSLRSRASLNLPELKSHVVVTNSFVFLAFLLYGGAAAVFIATAEAFISSWRFSKDKLTIAFNTGLAAFSTFLPVFIVKKIIYVDLVDEIHNGNYSNLFIALGILTLMQFALSSSLSAIYSSLKDGKSVWAIWKKSNTWAWITYSSGAVIAGLMAVLVDEMGFKIMFATIPIVVFAYLANRMYLKNVEISLLQAHQSKRYAKVLEKQSSALLDSEERFRSAFDFAPIGMALVSPEGKWLKVNHSLCNILGYSREELLQNDFWAVIHPHDLAETCELIKSQPFQKEQRFLNKQKEIVWVSWSGCSLTENQSELIFQIQDVSTKKQIEEKLQFEATHDALTGLPNRGFFMSRLEKSLAKFKQNPEKRNLSVLFIDLDRFKLVNDNLGHFAGDQLLIQISQRLSKCIRQTDMLARLAGDEFTILVEGTHELDEVVAIAQRIEAQFAEPFTICEQEIYSSASVGILKGRTHHTNADEVLRDADVAMYHAKTAGRARFEIFDNQIHGNLKESLRLENELRHAINRQELSVVYQPIFSIENDNFEGFEALARWNHKTLGLIPPDKFIRIAEESGLINALGEQILRQACTDGVRLRESAIDAENFSLSVNLSCKQFAQANLVEMIENILFETGFSAKNLILEITETVFFEQPDTAVKMLEKLCYLGIQISIDDFGTGYSNLNYLSQMPISTLKIDRSFISSIENGKQNLTIVKTILTMAQSLGIRVVAEGVENESQLHRLKSLNCEGAQGYYFAKPMSLAETEEFLQNQVFNIPDDFSEIPHITTLQ